MENMLSTIDYKNDKIHWLLRIIIYVAIVLFVGFIPQVIFVVLFELLKLPYIFSEIIMQIVTIIFCFIVVVMLENSNALSRLGLRTSNFTEFRKRYILGFALGTILMLLSALPIILFFTETFKLQNPPLYFSILVSLIFFLIQGASEEILVRGLIFPVIVKESRPITAIIITSLFFSLLHFLNPNVTLLSFLNLAFAGLVFGYCVLYFDNLWEACALHTAWNFVQTNILGFPVSGLHFRDSLFQTTVVGSDFYSGGKFGVEGSIFCVVVLGLTVVVFHILCVKKGINVFGKTQSL